MTDKRWAARKKQLAAIGRRMVRDAERKVGDTPQAWLAWLVEFATREVEPPADRTKVELFWLAQAAEIDAFVQALLDPPPPLVPGITPQWVSVVPRPVEQVPRIRADLRVRLGDLRKNGAENFVQPGNAHVYWTGERFAVYETARHQGMDRFYAAVVRLLTRQAPAVRRCAAPDCRALYFPSRAQALYCGKRCKNRVASALHRERHAAAVRADRRQRHAAAQRAKLGSKVKVGRAR